MKNVCYVIQKSKNRMRDIAKVNIFPKISYSDLWLYKLNTFKKLCVLCEMDHPVYGNVTAVLWCYYAHYRIYWTHTIMWVRMIYWYYIDQLWWIHVLVRHITVYRSSIILYVIDINLYGSSPKTKLFVYEYWFDRHRLVFAIVNNFSQQFLSYSNNNEITHTEKWWIV